MRFAIAAAAAIVLIAAVPASAENNMGGPVKKNGQCWKGSKSTDGGSFGSWNACPQSASATSATARRRPHS